MLDCKKDFPIFKQKYRGQDLIYLDSAATAQKPQVVIDTVTNFYTHGCANIHRAVHDLGEQATKQYNLVRTKVARFINADFNEVIFTPGTTAGINLVAATWGKHFIKPGDEIIVSIAEHHANLLVWQQLSKQVGAKLHFLNLTKDYQLDLQQYQKLLNSKTKLVAITYSSNVLGVINDLELIIALAKKNQTAVLIDAAQAIGNTKIDVKALGCDFLAFSGHKMLAPDGVGVLYLARKWHTQIDPYQLGGGMVSSVTKEQSTFLQSPAKFEAGTPAIGAILGLGAAVSYYESSFKPDEIKKHFAKLCTQLIDGLLKFSQIKIAGNLTLLKQAGHLVSFTIDGLHAHDVAAYLDQFAICVRAGNHCSQPLHDYLGLAATVRVSFQVYNSPADVEAVLNALEQLLKTGL